MKISIEDVDNRLNEFIFWIYSEFEKFFDLDCSELAKGTSELFIVLDSPFEKSPVENKHDWPEVLKMQTFFKENALFVQQGKLFFEEIQKLYTDTNSDVVLETLIGKSQTSFAKKTMDSYFLSNIFVIDNFILLNLFTWVKITLQLLRSY